MTLERITAAMLAASLLGALAPGEADACSTLPPMYPDDGTTNFPSNGMFSRDVSGWMKESGAELDFFEDQTLGAAVGAEGPVRLWRPVQDLIPGETLTTAECLVAESCSIVVGQPDAEAPAEPILKKPYVYLDEEEGRLEGLIGQDPVDDCGPSGPNHYMTFEIEGGDDRATFEQMWAIVHAGPTIASVRDTSSATMFVHLRDVFAGEHSMRVDLAEDSATFPSNRRFCVALELVDQAGNISPRSQPLCIDPTDKRAPYIDGPGAPGGIGSGGGGVTRGLCSTTTPSHSAPGAWWVVLVGCAWVVLGRRRRQG